MRSKLSLAGLALAVALLFSIVAVAQDAGSASQSSPSASQPAQTSPSTPSAAPEQTPSQSPAATPDQTSPSSPSAEPSQTSPSSPSAAPEQSPSSQSPSQAPDQSASPSSSTAPSSAQSFTGKVQKEHGKLVLKDQSGTKYQLDDQDKAKQFEGQNVTVNGTLDAANNTIHVQDISPSSSMKQ